MTASIEISDKNLNEIILKGINDLDKEVVADMAKEALRKYLENPETMQMLLFDYEKSCYSQRYYRDPQKWFLDLFKEGFTEDEVKEYKENFLKTIQEKRDGLIIEIFANLFSRMLVTDQFKYELRDAIGRMSN